MPIYEFQCKKCGSQIEVYQKMNDKQPTRCKKCGGRLEKLISQTAFQFKGEGWYVTDYARKGSVAEKSKKNLTLRKPQRRARTKLRRRRRPRRRPAQTRAELAIYNIRDV